MPELTELIISICLDAHNSKTYKEGLLQCFCKNALKLSIYIKINTVVRNSTLIKKCLHSKNFKLCTKPEYKKKFSAI